MDINFAAIGGAAVRHGLSLVAGYLVAKGVIADAQAAEFVGIGMGAFAFAWSWVQKHEAGKKLAEALDR